MTLAPLDYVVILVPFAIVSCVAIAMSRQMKGVAGFLAADRSAGRYLIATAGAELGAGVTGLLTILEVFSRAALSLRFWFSLTEVVLFLFGLLGIVVYRFRQTRSLTFHQFFERRYSKGVRVFASFLNVLSGILAFGVSPAVAARFFVYFCGMPETLPIAGLAVPTFAVVMSALMAISLLFALGGGQISIMVTDCLEGVISSVFYLAIAAFVITTVSVAQMHDVLTSGPPGASFVDPLDIAGRKDFDGWYVAFGLMLYIYQYRGAAWNQGFAASARTAHESRMASILGTWRQYCSVALTMVVGLAGLAVLHHPAFAAQRLAAEATLARIPSEQLRTQMSMPAALGALFVPGIRGALCAVLLFGVIAGQGSALHGYGATILQDVVLPLRKRAFTTAGHLRALRWTIVAVGVLTTTFSYFFKPVDYLKMLMELISAIYLGGIGVVIWGGLYWRRGTTAGAWSALISGAGLGVGFNAVTQFWPSLAPALARVAGAGPVGQYLTAHAARFPLNGQVLALIAAVVATALYFIVSLCGRAAPFDLNAMLHRNEPSPDGTSVIAIAGDVDAALRRPWLDRFLNLTPEFSRTDRGLAKFTFGWTISLKVFAVGVLLWTIFVGHPSPDFWFGYSMFTGVWLVIAIACVVTVWFTIGVTRDLLTLFRALRLAARSAADDGTEVAPDATRDEDAVTPAAPTLSSSGR